MIYEAERNGEVVKVKQCKKCFKYKRVDDFYKRLSGNYEMYCMKCKNKQSAERHKERYRTDEVYREKQKAKKRKLYAKRKEEKE